MISSFIKTAQRIFSKQKTHSIINIAGLSIGLCASLVIVLFVIDQLSFDNFHEKKDRIALLPMTWHFGDTDLPTGANCGAGGPFVQEAFSEVENYVRINVSKRSFQKGEDFLVEDKIYYADSAFFEIFSFPFIAGNPKNSISRPNTIVIAKTIADKYFEIKNAGSYQDIIGKALISENGKTFQVTGVVNDPPKNSHLQFSAVISMTSLSKFTWEPSWNNSNLFTYVLFHQPVEEISTKVKGAFEEKLKQKYGNDFSAVSLDLVTLKDIYLRNTTYPVPNSSNIQYVKIFGGISLLILLIAIVNYINLATSRSVERAKEVGVRKVMGAYRAQLINQFLIESFFTVSIAFAISLMMTMLALPFFNFFMKSNITLGPVWTLQGVALLIIMASLISAISGMYPAFIISSYNPVKVLKGKLKDSPVYIRLREYMVIFQFGISITLIICTIILSRQVQYMKSKDLGFKKDNLVSLSLDSLTRTRLEPLQNALSQKAFVVSTSNTNQLPISIRNESAINAGETFDESSRRLVRMLGADHRFIETAGMKISNGRDFNGTSKETEIIINESGAAFFGWSPAEAVGKKIFIWGLTREVQGVVQDFHFSSLKEPIKPLVIMPQTNMGFLLIQTNGEDATMIAESLAQTWKQINPESSFQLNFLTDRYDLLYESETRLERLVSLFSILSILVACLGLFGLCSYLISQRTKEIGIRKVLGASFRQLFTMVSFEFLKPVIIALIISVPLSFYFTREWLAEFNYRIPFSWLVVILTGLGTILIAASTIFYHSFDIAKANPAKTLKEN